MKIRTLLCFDYGSKRIGVAVGQILTRTASPLETISVHRNRPDWLRIEQLTRQWQPEAMVVGRPLCMDGTIQDMTRLSERFSRQLQGRFHLPVYTVDERLSSYEASLRTGQSRGIDAVAAQAILETWLNENDDKIPADSSDE